MNENSKPQRGDSTREALLEAATRVFARVGYDAASSRMLADAAGVNQALISYHFGGKQGLYLAVFAAMEASLSQRLLPAIARVRQEIESIEAAPHADPERSVACMIRLLHTLADVFLGEDTADWARLMLREQQEPSEAFELVYHGPMKRMLRTMTRLVELAAGADDEVEPGIVALTLVSQVLVFRLAYAAVVRHLGWEQGIGEDELRRIKQQLALNVSARFRDGTTS